MGALRIRWPVALFAFLGLLAIGGGCERCGASAPELVHVGTYGRFLERIPSLSQRRRAPRIVVRALEMQAFEPGYQRIRIAAPSTVTGELWASFFSARPSESTRFEFECHATAETLSLFTFVGASGVDKQVLVLRVGEDSYSLKLGQRGELRLHEFDLPSPPCGRESERFLVSMTAAAAGVLISPPVIKVRARRPRPPLVFVSIDTLRADYWRNTRPMPPGLARFYEEAIRFENTFAAAPTTHPSHRVMLSGASHVRASYEQPTDDLSWVSRLRNLGYATLGFVAGGYIRAPFGFGRTWHTQIHAESPGFALGFDLYLEGMSPGASAPMVGGRAPQDAFAREDSIESHTLGPSLERSLRWFRTYGADAAFHFVHGYDVHEYRSVARRFWDEVIVSRPSSMQGKIMRCAKRATIHLNEKWAIHHLRNRKPRPARAMLACQRLLTNVFYEARVRSVQQMLSRYFVALEDLGVYDKSLIIVSSDHGESLLDESALDAPFHWDHNRLNFTNLRVPLWIKPPSKRTCVPGVSAQAGSVDLRAILGATLGVDLGDSVGIDPRRESIRQRPIEVAELTWAGVILPSEALCAWPRSPANHPTRTMMFLAGKGPWRPATQAERIACRQARSDLGALLGADDAKPTLSKEQAEELRALGYLE